MLSTLSEKKVVKFRIKTEHNIVHFRVNYFPIETEDCNHSEELDVLSDILYFGLFLPKMDPNGSKFIL